MTNVLNERENFMNEVVKILKEFKSTKTGWHSLFTGIQDFRIDEMELLEFLQENCPETISVLISECEKYQEELKKSSSISWLLMQTVFQLHKIYHFGWLTQKKVGTLDTVTDISQISLKERYITLLGKMSNYEPNIDAMFIRAWNQTQPHLNFLRAEQCLAYLREELEAKGIEIPYKDYSEACIHGVGSPYFSRENYGYFIVDNYGCFDGKLFMCPDDNNELKWTYMASRNGDSWYRDKQRAEDKVNLLEKLNEVAGIDGLSWRVEYLNRHDIPDVLARYEKWIDKWNNQSLFIYKDIPKGCKGKHMQAVKSIRIGA